MRLLAAMRKLGGWFKRLPGLSWKDTATCRYAVTALPKLVLYAPASSWLRQHWRRPLPRGASALCFLLRAHCTASTEQRDVYDYHAETKTLFVRQCCLEYQRVGRRYTKQLGRLTLYRIKFKHKHTSNTASQQAPRVTRTLPEVYNCVYGLYTKPQPLHEFNVQSHVVGGSSKAHGHPA